MASMGLRNSPDEYVVQQLNELFGSTLEFDLIKKVAASCKYDVMESSNKLLEISTMGNTNIINLTDIDMTETANRGMASGTSSTPLSSSSSYTTLPNVKSRRTLEFEKIISNVNTGYRVLVLLRGLPGSGKSSLAKRILESTVGYDANYQLHILSTDDYFYQNPQGTYQYDVRQIEDAHNWNQNRAFQAMSRGFSPVIIDNTNTRMWEMKVYATMAMDYGYILEILEPDTHWKFNDLELFKRNHHGVTRKKIQDMIERYEKNITPNKLLSSFNLRYTFQVPPQLRLYPPIGVSDTVEINASWSNATDHQVETINLMNFDDSEEEDVNKKSANCNGTSKWVAPISSNDNEIFQISSDEENDTPKNDDLYAQWGINESSLKSWDIVTPLQDVFKQDLTLLEPSSSKEVKVETADGSTVTEDEYFRLLQSNTVLPGMYGNLKIIDTLNRDINHGTPKKTPQISAKLTLDKSCMTDDIYENYTTHMEELENLFPGVPKSHLNYWYNKCKGDLEWAIEFLLEGKDDVISLIEDDDVDNDKNETDNEVSDNNNSSSPNTENRLKRKTRRRLEITSEDKAEMKKLLESKFDIGKEHYSHHVHRIKQYRLRNSSVEDNTTPSTSQIPNPPPKSKSESSVITDDEVIVIDSDIEVDEVDVDNTCEKPVFEDTIELNLGETFVSQLEEKFADPNIQYPKGFLPVVQMPVTLAKQLYTFYIESVYQQMENQEHVMETLIKEDEEFARKLQNEEVSNGFQQPTEPILKDIMHDQRRAQKTYQTEIETWKTFNPDTLAMKLTKQKLSKIFPTIPQDTLEEVLNAHDNKYLDTVETLIASTGSGNIKQHSSNITEPPIKDEDLHEMKEAQKKHSIEAFEDQRLPAEKYREEATKYLRTRGDLYQKAQQYYQRGMQEVAQFYSGLASLQTIYYDRANNMAATAFLDEHSKRLQDFNTLDLHFLYVKEAIPALDVFLDRNINLLKHSTKNSEYLQIITGRGKRSENGISKIKPAVMTRLKQRNINFMPLNPGLLKVKITKTSSVTSEIVS